MRITYTIKVSMYHFWIIPQGILLVDWRTVSRSGFSLVSLIFDLDVRDYF